MPDKMLRESHYSRLAAWAWRVVWVGWAAQDCTAVAVALLNTMK